MALERLIQDGRIHPARIEDIVQKCEQELDTQVREVGEQATFDAGVHGIHPESCVCSGNCATALPLPRTCSSTRWKSPRSAA